jgi:hypothetical protein
MANRDFVFRDNRVAPGSKSKHRITVTEEAVGPLQLPLYVINGASEGTRLYIHNGIHGDEYEGAHAINLLYDALDPRDLSGTLFMVPMVNIPGFLFANRRGNVDYLDMNRIFPGNKQGMISERIAALIMEELLPMADYAIDMHSGGCDLCMYPIVCCQSDETSFRFARHFGFETIIRDDYVQGNFQTAGTEAGVPTIAIEKGGEARLRYGNDYMNGSINVLKYLRMLPGKPQLPEHYRVGRGYFGRAQCGGLLVPETELGTTVTKGQRLACIIGIIDGGVLEELTAPYDGVVVGMRSFARIRPGDYTIWVAEITETH